MLNSYHLETPWGVQGAVERPLVAAFLSYFGCFGLEDQIQCAPNFYHYNYYNDYKNYNEYKNYNDDNDFNDYNDYNDYNDLNDYDV